MDEIDIIVADRHGVVLQHHSKRDAQAVGVAYKSPSALRHSHFD